MDDTRCPAWQWWRIRVVVRRKLMIFAASTEYPYNVSLFGPFLSSSARWECNYWLFLWDRHLPNMLRLWKNAAPKMRCKVKVVPEDPSSSGSPMESHGRTSTKWVLTDVGDRLLYFWKHIEGSEACENHFCIHIQIQSHIRGQSYSSTGRNVCYMYGSLEWNIHLRVVYTEKQVQFARYHARLAW